MGGNESGGPETENKKKLVKNISQTY